MISSSLKPEAQIFKKNVLTGPHPSIDAASKSSSGLSRKNWRKPINYGPIMASLTISAIPMLLMFIFLQKYYVEGIASTGIKG